MKSNRILNAIETTSDFNKVRQNIFSIDFMRLGYINKVYTDGNVVDVVCFNDAGNGIKDEIKGVEIMRIGTKDVFIHFMPKENDIVAIFSFKDYKQKLDKGGQSKQVKNILPYSRACVKCFVIQPIKNENDAKLIFKIKDDKIEIVSKMETSISCEKKAEIKANAELSIDCQDKLKLKATSGIEIDGGTEVKIKGTSGVDINNGNFKVM